MMEAFWAVALLTGSMILNDCIQEREKRIKLEKQAEMRAKTVQEKQAALSEQLKNLRLSQQKKPEENILEGVLALTEPKKEKPESKY
jgi:hypothetical protein